MDGDFKTRRKELEAECHVARDLFAGSSKRLQQFMKPFLTHYRRHEQATHATQMAQGLCSDLECKNGESIAYLFGLDRKAIQHFLGQSTWVDLPLRLELGRQIGTELGEPDGVIAFDPSTFPKSGDESVGVARQWCGRLGKIENCQVGVYLGYVSGKGHALAGQRRVLSSRLARTLQSFGCRIRMTAVLSIRLK